MRQLEWTRCLRAICAGGMLLGGNLVPAAAADGPAANNLAHNPGFEDVGADGWVLEWADKRPVFTVSTQSPRQGTRCMRYENQDASRYVLCSSPITLEPGRQYDIEAWVRTDNVTGAGSGATVCLQWWGEDGGFIGGAYPPGVKGTTEQWRRVTARTGTIPAHAARMDLTVYLRQGCTGVAFWDDIVVREYQPPLVTLLLTDAYRDQSSGGTVRVSAALNLVSHSLTPRQVLAELRVLDSSGATRAVLSPSHVTVEQAEFLVDADSLSPGIYRLDCRVRSRDDSVSGEVLGRLIRVAAFPERKAFIDAHGRLLLDGRPFFPLGTYWGGVSPEHLEIYADSGFNCMMPYTRLERQTLDLVDARGIKVIYSVKDLYGGRGSLQDEDQAQAMIRRVVGDLKDHPAIMAWYINDELPLSMLEALTAHRDLLEELDPGRPTWVVLYQIGQVRSYIPTFDVIGTDPYPVPTKAVATVLDYTRRTVAASFGYRPVWMVPQIFNWASYKKDAEEKKKYRAPTLEEMRCMAWQSIAGGANGLVFYSWMDLWRMNTGVADGGRALVVDPFAERWQDVRTMAAEVARHIPILLSVAPPLQLGHVTAPDAVAWRLYGYLGQTFLVAVNSGETPATAEFTFAADVLQAAASLGSRTLHLAERTLRLDFAPHGVRVIQVTPAPE